MLRLKAAAACVGVKTLVSIIPGIAISEAAVAVRRGDEVKCEEGLSRAR